MRLCRINITNFRSIRASGDIRIEPLQALVGENSSGKSNVLRAVQCFLSSGAGGMLPSDFNDPGAIAVIECEFVGLTPLERRKLRPYLMGDRVILRKQLHLEEDPERQRKTVKAEYHGYQAEPTALHYSLEKIEERGGRPDWVELARAGGFLESALTPEGKVTKASFRAALDRYLRDHEVEYDTAELGQPQALGIPQNLLACLPEFHLLPAITDYADEIDRRSSSTVFRKLMGDLSERLLCTDPRYREIEQAFARVRELLNPPKQAGDGNRLAALGVAENQLRDALQRLMPSVRGVSLAVEVDEPKDIFARGVSIKVDDGVLTDVLDKGHGMQRSLVFGLLQMLIQSARTGAANVRPIILAIEEPELYIHPHSQRLIYGVLKDFAGAEGEDAVNDQVLYTTHSPAFIDIACYERIAILCKPDAATGTVVKQCEPGVLGTAADRKGFKLLTSFGLKHNELFFAREVILVEGPDDEIAVIATARKLGLIRELPEERGLSVVVAGNKGAIPKFQKILNAFRVSYGVLYETDGRDDAHPENAPIVESLNGNRIARIPKTLERLLNVGCHFRDQHHTRAYFSDPANISAEMEDLVRTLLPQSAPPTRQ